MATSFLDRKRYTKTRNQTRRSSFLQVERLEERTVLTGNVIATVAGGYLRLFGDAGDNQLEVQRVGTANTVAITSLDGTTRINGQTSLTLNGVSQGLIASLGNGDDVLELSGNSDIRFRVNGNTSINTGNGNDIVKFTNYVSLGSLAVSTGAGADQVLTSFDPEAPQIDFGSLRVWGSAVINTGTENDIVSIDNATFAQNLVLDASSGNDIVDVRNSTVGRLTFLSGGLGADSLNNVGNTFAYSPFISLFETLTAIAGPSAGNDTATVAENGSVTIDVLNNDVATTGTIDVSTVVITQAPTRGTASVNADGTITYTNNGAEFATDSFRYTVTNSEGDVSNEATVTITVTPVNDLPVGGTDSFTVNEGATVSLNLAGNDVDAEGRIRLNSIVVVTPPANGTVTVNANGTVTYVSSGAEVTSDSFTYTIADLDGGVSLPITVNLTITPVNDAPVVGAISNVTTIEDTATGSIAVNISDAETAAGSLTVTATSSNQTLVPNANIVVGGSAAARTLVISPAANASGTANITVNVSDGAATTTQTFTLTVNAVNDAPTIGAVADVTINEDTPSSPISVTVGDIETPNALTVTAISSNTAVVANHGVSITGSGAGRTVVVTPVANASGTTDITLTVSDGTVTTTEVFTVNVTAQNDLPTITAVADVGVAAGATIDPISVTIGDQETAAGSLTVTATSDNQALITNGGIQVTGTTDARTVTITPVVGATGTANITLTVNDGTGGTVTEIFAVNINAAPTITAIADQTIDEDGATASLAFTINDAETAAGNLTLAVTSSNPALVPVANVQLGGSLENRTVVVTPVANASGSSDITITVTDSTGISASETFQVTVNAVNDLPTLSAVANINVNEDATIAPISLTVGDIETALGGLVLSASSDNQAVIANSGLALSGTAAARTIVITPVANASGTANITLSLDDGQGGITTRTFAVVIAPVNDIPVAATLSANVLEGGVATVNLAAASTDVDGTIDASTTVITQAPVNGTLVVNANGTVTYTHNDSETTTDSFRYTIRDNQGAVSAAATVTLNIQAVNDAPVVNDELLTLNSNVLTALTVNVLANDTDPDGPNALTVSSVIGGTVGTSFAGTYGTITLNANGSFTYVIDPTAVDEFMAGTDLEELIAYEVSDGQTVAYGVVEIDIRVV